ncbi:MAG: D-alanyl-D-alanine carboxypeptidase family protein [Candidatus Didemnitutus sp.]|nr:D-alanyl-D-alanine carboxypeptidase family protein [Candidatus Didemnitutus sp.]
MQFFRRFKATLVFFVLLSGASALEKISRDPYVGAIVIDANNGKVLFEDGADVVAYPASVTKLMTFAVVMDRVVAGQLSLDALITVSAEAARTGGSQVYLKQGEVFTVDDLLVALIVSSANDAAIALASHVGGSREGFVTLMNEKARALGMTNTHFQSPHGLPPARGQQPDVSTARDLSVLSRHLIQHDRVLAYSSIKVRMLREKSAQPFEMRSHNHLLGKFAGCDGLKTGYFSAGGFSLAATAERQGRRIIAVTLGSETSKIRDFKVMELLERGFASLAAMPSVPTTLPVAGPVTAPAAPAAARANRSIPTLKTQMEPPPDAASIPRDPIVTFRVIPPAPESQKK